VNLLPDVEAVLRASRTPVGVRNGLRDLDTRPDEERVQILLGLADALTRQAGAIIAERVNDNWSGSGGWTWSYVGDVTSVSRQAATKRWRRYLGTLKASITRG
jgi:hypothetical protein